MTLGDAHAIDVAIRRLPVVGPADAMALDLAVLVRTSGGVVALLRFERDGLGVGGVAYGLPVAGSGNVRRYHYCPVDVDPEWMDRVPHSGRREHAPGSTYIHQMHTAMH